MAQDVQYHWESLIGRKAARPDPAPIREALGGKCVLVTGAGGSIGSALVQGAAEQGARQILLLDASEQNLYRVSGKLGALHVPILLNVSDRAGLNDLFERFHPQIIFHGAAFKHVPLMEQNPFAAIGNNSLGTFHLAQAAIKHGAEHLILISTDKAVDPISIMGASKRIAELVLIAMPAGITRMTALRLGNVLGSEGSVFPLFLEQIALGEPVTVTHPDASRYFTTIEEAVSLLLLAATRQVPGRILVPELGDPILIVDIARKLIAENLKSLVGPAIDAHILFTRLRPGDKLSESLISSTETFIAGPSGPLRAVQRPNSSPRYSGSDLGRVLDEMEISIEQRDLNRLMELVLLLVPEYRPSAVLRDACAEFAVKGNA